MVNKVEKRSLSLKLKLSHLLCFGPEHPFSTFCDVVAKSGPNILDVSLQVIYGEAILY